MIKERIKHIENKINSIREHKEQNKHLFKETDYIAHSVELNRLKDELKWLNKFNDELSKELTNFVDFYNDRQIRSQRINYDEIEIYLDSNSAE